MRAAAYLRVSTDGQTNENQRLAVAKFCGERGWTLVRTYEETVSGAAAKRPAFDRLMRDAVNGRGAGWDVLVVVALDRLTRAGARAALEALERLGAHGLKVASIREPWLDTSGPFGDVLVAFAATFAKLERLTLVERTKAGLARARAQGKALGRPAADAAALEAAAGDLVRARGAYFNARRVVWQPASGSRCGTFAQVASKHGVSESTLRRFLRARSADSANTGG